MIILLWNNIILLYYIIKLLPSDHLNYSAPICKL
jgi:hypothetical protein